MTKNKSQKNIPGGWRIVKVEDTFDFIGTYSHSKEQMSYDVGNEQSIYNIHYGDIHTKYSTYINFLKDRVPFLKKDNEIINKQKLLKNGDLILADASEDYDGVCDSVELLNLENSKCISGLHTFALRDSKKYTVLGYRSLLFRNPIVHNWLMRVSTYSKVYGVTKTSLQKTDLFVPPLPEQKQIVKVLEVWDEGIEKLGRKIEMKKNIKKGLMQELLSGKKRLAGFSGKWEEKRLGELGEIVTGNTPPKKDKENYGNDFYWATAEDFNSKYIFDTKIKMSEKGKQISRFLPKNSILITCIASVGKNAIAKVPLATNQQINSIIVNEKNDFEFVYYLINNSTNTLKRYAGGGALLMLNKIDFSKIKLVFPNIEEQKAIAEILTTADKEIEKLEEKLKKFKEQKKFLLNNLITGKIRVQEDI